VQICATHVTWLFPQVCATLKVALPTLAPPGGGGGGGGCARRAGATRTALFTTTADGGLGLLAPLGEAPYRRLELQPQA